MAVARFWPPMAYFSSLSVKKYIFGLSFQTESPVLVPSGDGEVKEHESSIMPSNGVQCMMNDYMSYASFDLFEMESIDDREVIKPPLMEGLDDLLAKHKGSKSNDNYEANVRGQEGPGYLRVVIDHRSQMVPQGRRRGTSNGSASI
ncbi:hypothetical protein TEA_003840 [Camellia sinensis var. sinensis]|uniref:Uncharacterized protein n=1 Tax=Camellia sinensis var. sinensis TaxID=542762 RepID=A0A4S4EWJ8_CAMSN|nr:hypothetical protein TEA_003840 [Camellia sinensis var. sinensis]